MDTMALKVKAYPSIAKVISIIRKYSSSSMGEIKSAVEHDQLIFEVDYLSISGIRKLRRCYDELLKAGIECDIYDEDEEVISREIISNWIEALRDTEKDTMAQMASEGDDNT